MFGEWRATAAGDSAERSVSVPGTPEALAGAEEVTYRTSFSDPRGPGEDVAVLTLHGLYAHAAIEVSCRRLAAAVLEHDAYFEPFRVPLLPDRENRLSVTCRAPEDRFGGLYDTDRVPEAAAVPGIWWGASLEARPLPCIERVGVRPELAGDGARLHVTTTVLTDGPLDDRLTYSLRPAGEARTRATMERRSVEAAEPGRTTVEHTLEVRDPALWWPRQLGAQNRYALRAKLGDSERTVTTGICEVAVEGGDLLVNGRRLPVRGVCLATDDPADVDRAREVGANLLRAPAHVLSPAVYEACDEAGLLVWQGLPLTGPGGFSVERGRRLARALEAAYGRHPSLAVVGVHDEPTDTLAGLGSGLFDRLRLRVRAWRTDYDRTDADAVADAVPGHRAVVPVVGGPGVDHDAAAYYPGGEYGESEDIDRLLDRYPTDLLAAFGAPSGAASDDRAGEGPARQRAVVRTVAERARGRGLGVVAATLRDARPGGMGVYAPDGSPKPAREALAVAFEPVQAFLPDPSPGESTVAVVNGSPEPVSATLAWTAGDAGGSRDLAVDPAARWTGEIALPAGAGAVELSLAVGDRTVTNRYDLAPG